MFGGRTNTFLAVEHKAQVLVGLRVFADESENPFVGFIVSAERYPVQLAVMLHILQHKADLPESPAGLCVAFVQQKLNSLWIWDPGSSRHRWRSAAPLWGFSDPLTS